MISSETTVDVPLLQQFEHESGDTLPIFNAAHPDVEKSWISWPSVPYSSMIRIAKNLLSKWPTLLPSWYPSRFSQRNNEASTLTPPAVPSPTAYMSGLRGLASLLVFIHHYPLDYFEQLHNGYHATPKDTSLFQLPMVRIIYSGRFMVAIFFVLSGYVLSHKPLKLARRGKSADLLDTLSSSVFRRFIRLFVPILVSSFLTMVCIHYGWYSSLNKGIKVPPALPWGQQIRVWVDVLVTFMDPFIWTDVGPSYGPQLWTLPIEFRGSMLVFLIILGLSKAKTAIRMSSVFAFAYFCIYGSKSWKNWDMFLFISGIFLAELQIIRTEATSSRGEVLPNSKKATALKSGPEIFWCIFFLISLFLASWPDKRADWSPGYIYLSNITPLRFASVMGRSRLWTSLSAVTMLLCFDNLPWLQRPFNTPVMEYLGDISFSLYIVHVPILYTFGRYFTVACIDFTGSTHLGFILGALVVTPLTFWAADVYWRFVDVRAVEFGRWMWTKCTIRK